MSDLLTAEQLADFCGTKQVSKQRKTLQNAGIFFIDKWDGTLSVCWTHIHNPTKKPSQPIKKLNY